MSITSTAAPKPGRAPRILDAKWDGKSTFDVTEVAEIFECSPWLVRDQIKSGELAVVKFGRLFRIARHVIERKLAV
jgi:excisionase family DNA binding protein